MIESESAKSESDLRKIQETLDDLLYYRCATDIELFCQTYFPHYCEYPFNDFHVDLFNSYQFGERRSRRGRAAPRGYSKSGVVAMFKPLHDLCYKLERFIVILSNTEPQAKQKLKDIRAEILTNESLVSAYNLSFASGRKAGETDYIAMADDYSVRFLALGSGTEIRGIRFGAYRPSKIILDDIEHSTKVFNESIRDSFEDWYNDVVTKIGDTKTNIEFIGTVLHPKALLKNILSNPSYDTKTYQAVKSWAKDQDLWNKWKVLYCNLDDESRVKTALEFYNQNEEQMLKGADVLWPEKESYYYLMVELVETGRRSFMKEKMNSPLSDDECLFDREEMHYYKETADGLYINNTGATIPWRELRAFGTIDPSTGLQVASNSKKGDYACRLSGYQDTKGRLFLHDDSTKRISPSKQIADIFDSHQLFKYEKFAVETNLYRNLLLDNIIEEGKRREKEDDVIIKIPFYDIVQTDNKIKRIFTIEPKVINGWILFNETLSETFMTQFDEFPKGDHDDGPDATEMLWSLVNGRYDTKAVQLNPRTGR